MTLIHFVKYTFVFHTLQILWHILNLGQCVIVQLHFSSMVLTEHNTLLHLKPQGKLQLSKHMASRVELGAWEEIFGIRFGSHLKHVYAASLDSHPKQLAV